MALPLILCDKMYLLDPNWSSYVLLGWLWAFLRWLEMMFCHVRIADDVIVNDGVFARAEVPGFLLGVVRPVLKALQLVIEGEDVVSLLVTQRSILPDNHR